MPTPSTSSASRSAALPIVRPGGGTSTTNSPRLNEASSSSSVANTSLSSPLKKPASLSQIGESPSSTSAWSTSNNSNKLCKNIAIFGSCKYEGKGCAFSHDVDGKRSNAATPTSSRPSTPAISGLTASSTSFTPSAAIFTPSSASSANTNNAGPASPSLLANSNSNSNNNNNFASLAASANVFVPKGVSVSSGPPAPSTSSTPAPLTYASSVVSTPRGEGPPSLSKPAAASSISTIGSSINNADAIAKAAAAQDEDEEEQDFDGLNPYAAVQSPASTSGNLPAMSSSYHSAHSGQGSSTSTSGYDPSTPSFEPSYPVHEQARIPDEGHSGQQHHNHHQQQQQQQEYGHYDDYASEGHPMHTQQMPNMDAANPYLNGGMQGMELYGQVMHQPLQYHLYHPSLPHLTPAHFNQHSHVMQTFFMSPTIREELQRKQEACYPPSVLAPNRDLLLNDRYWGLIPLDKAPPNLNGGAGSISSRLYGWRSWLFRCTNDRDGKLYAVRRMEGYRLTNPESIMLIEKWSHIIHPSIVGVREAFTTRAFGDHSVCFIYDYHPLSSTLLEIHLTTPARGAPPPPPIPERVLWSYLVQLASAVRTVHKAGMAIRCLDPSKVIITGKNRVRINGIGILDVLAYDGGKSTASFQQEDLLSLGKLFLSLACRSLSAIHNIQQSLDMGVARTYTSDFSNALLYLLSKPNPQRKSIDEFLGIISGHVDDELRGAFDQADLLEGDLMRELENGRLFRLMAKFGFINERPEYDHDPRWAETGDRYIIKLFRDYVFHQIDEHGRPVIDLSHVLTCLNKLDAGVDEQIVLISRDEQSCLIVSYREVRACLENSFRELAR